MKSFLRWLRNTENLLSIQQNTLSVNSLVQTWKSNLLDLLTKVRERGEGVSRWTPTPQWKHPFVLAMSWSSLRNDQVLQTNSTNRTKIILTQRICMKMSNVCRVSFTSRPTLIIVDHLVLNIGYSSTLLSRKTYVLTSNDSSSLFYKINNSFIIFIYIK